MDGIQKVGFNPKPSALAAKASTSKEKSGLNLKGTDLYKSTLEVGNNFPPKTLALSKAQIYSSQDKNSFISENKDLLYVIGKSEKAQELLGKKEVRTRADLSDIVAESAYNDLNAEAKKSITLDGLKKSPILASLLSLNTGGLLDAVNKDAANAKILASSANDTKTDLLDNIAKKTAALFEEDSPLNDEEFFKTNTKAALYLYNNPSERERFISSTDRTDLAKDFKEKVNHQTSVDTFETFLAQKADSATDSGAYTTSYFSDNTDIAELVVASTESSNIPSIAQYLTLHPELNLGNVSSPRDRLNADQLLANVLADQTKNYLGASSPITESFLRANTGFSRFVLKNEDFTKKLFSTDAKKDLQILFGDKKDSKEVDGLVGKLKETISNQFRSGFEDPIQAYSIMA